MNPSVARGQLRRRGFLGCVSASLSAAVASCQDEPVLVQKNTDPDLEPVEYQELLREYFGEAGLNDAKSIGGYHVAISRLSSGEAYESTAQTRALVNAAEDIELALTSLDQRVLQDFVELSVVDVAGWTLSQSEVDLCVLAWLG